MTPDTMAVRYKPNIDKTIEALVLLAELQPGIDVVHAVKCLYFAEKWHLNAYGRPITGDRYRAWKNGPLPIFAYELICRRGDRLGAYELDAVTAALEVRGIHRNLWSRRPANRLLLSRTDVKCIERAVSEIGTLSIKELTHRAHEESAFQATPRDEVIDYADMIESNRADRDEVIAEIRESAPYVVL